MSKIFIYAVVFILIINISLIPCDGLRRGNGGSKIKGSKESNNPRNTVLGSTNAIGENNTQRGVGISAWGIITLVVSLILAGAGMYYFSICYPILCKKSRKYDMIGLPSVA